MTTGTLLDVDPRTLVVAANVRKDTKITKAFTASIKQHGVRTPITAENTDEGMHVLDGQRRTLAAIEAGLDTVPVYLVPAPLADAARVVEQLIVNEQREHLTTSEHAAAYKELALFGVSAEQIARRTNTPAKTVKTVLAIANSETASKILEQGVTLEDAALLIEFEDDEKVVADITDSLIRGGNTGWIVTRAREERSERTALAAVDVELAATGLPIIEAPSYDSDARSIRYIYTDEDRTVELNAETAIAGAGDDLRVYAQRDTEWEGAERRTIYTVAYAVTNWEAHGWHSHKAYSSSATKGPLTDADKAARKQAREDTKSWVTATTLRIGWLQEHLQRKDLPAGYQVLIAEHMLSSQPGATPTQEKMRHILLQLEYGDYPHNAIHDALAANPTRAMHIALAVAIAHIEGGSEWDKKGWSQKAARGYLATLARWGFVLSDFEQGLVDADEKAAA
jgi:ParB family chromosome partitioning protein